MKKVSSPASNIYEVDGIASPEEVAEIMQLASMIDVWNYDPITRVDDSGNIVYDAEAWLDTTCGADLLAGIDFARYSVLESVARRALNEAESLFECRLLFREPSLVRLDKFSKTRQAHADKENIDGSPKIGMEDYDVSVVMYHNSDFSGGDLVFPLQKVRITPSAGKIVIFPGSASHIHFVDTIYSGIRWSSPLFFSIVG